MTITHDPAHESGCHLCATAAIEAWNAVHPVGTLVQFTDPVNPLRTIEARTSTPAQMLANRMPAVRVERRAGALNVNQIEAVEESTL